MKQKNKSGNLRGLNSSKSHFKSRGNNQPKLTSTQKDELINKTIEWKCQGLTSSEIVENIILHAPLKITVSHAYRLLNLTEDRIHEFSKHDALTIISVHVGHYEKMYRYFNSIGHVKGMNAAMKAKERLLGLHRDANKVVINQTTTTTTTTVNEPPPYDFTKLNDKEKSRLDELLNKMKR